MAALSHHTYTGCTQGTCHLIVPKNRYMNIGIKRNLQAEVDMTLT
jgi:hypothetical protein